MYNFDEVEIEELYEAIEGLLFRNGFSPRLRRYADEIFELCPLNLPAHEAAAIGFEDWKIKRDEENQNDD